MYFRYGSGISKNYNNAHAKVEYNYYCPFCIEGFTIYGNLIDHIVAFHGGKHEFVYLNNQKVQSTEQTVKRVFSLKLFSFRKGTRKIHLIDNFGKLYSFSTQEYKYEYDVSDVLKGKLYSKIKIENIDAPVCIYQKLDINNVTIDKIINSKYNSYLFDEQISEGKFSPNENLTYLKMLIYEKKETYFFIEYINQMHFDDSRELQEIYYYHFLYTGLIKAINEKLPLDIARFLLYLLNGDYQSADTILSGMKERTNDNYGCQLMLSLLRSDKLSIDYLIERYRSFGIIGIIENILCYYADYDRKSSNFNINRLIDEIRLFKQYPLISALIELNDSINNRGSLSYDSYSLLRELTPLAAIHYCYTIEDSKIKEKIFKSVVKTHNNSKLLKEYALSNDCFGIKPRIRVIDGALYEKAVKDQNAILGNIFSNHFIDNFPFDDQITITPLGGEKEVGASCFIISYKGFNIMLDCGIDVKKYGDEAYPLLDSWNKGIDIIVISHAHIDHSGGVPKAHAMWPDADIITTSPTAVFLKYQFLDMAKVKNGISNEFEIENIKIEKNVMFDTLKSINTINYNEWFNINENIKMRLHSAGHIVGAAMIELIINGKTLLYTGDYCNYSQFLTESYDLLSLPREIDYLITESTYIRKNKVDWNQQYIDLKGAIIKAIQEKHSILLPSASVGHSQELVCLIGEMKLSGELADNINLCIAGMAIPATTQIVPFMNSRYKKVLSMFEEFDSTSYPKYNSIVIASSGSMNRGSASYRIANYWNEHHINFTIIANDFLDNLETDCKNKKIYGNVERLPLSTHADLNGIISLVEYVAPKVISIVHRGSRYSSDINELLNICKRKFSNDILYHDLKANRCVKIFDMYDGLVKGNLTNERN